MQKILEVAIDNCLLMTDVEFYEAYGLDANPDDWCYEVIYSGEYIESYWFSIENFWNDWEDFKRDEILERFDQVIDMKDNYNPNLHNRKEQIAFAMGVFETKMQYGIGDDDDIFDEFLSRLYEIGEYDIHHRGWMQNVIDRIYDDDNLLLVHSYTSIYYMNSNDILILF